MQQLTTSIGTRLGSVDKRLDDLKKLQISNNRQIHRKPQPGLPGRDRFVKHALLRLCGDAATRSKPIASASRR